MSFIPNVGDIVSTDSLNGRIYWVIVNTEKYRETARLDWFCLENGRLYKNIEWIPRYREAFRVHHD